MAQSRTKAAEAAPSSADLTIEQVCEITGQTDLPAALYAYLQRAQTPADLRAAGLAIKPLTEHLTPEETESLRGDFVMLLATIQHEVKTEWLDNKVVIVTRARYTQTKVGPTYRLRGTWQHEDGNVREWQSWMPGSSNGPVYRFFNQRAPQAYPVTVIFRKEPHPKEPDKTMWTVEEVAPATPRQLDRVPF